MTGSNNLKRLVVAFEINDMTLSLRQRLERLIEDCEEDQCLLMTAPKEFGEDTTNEEMIKDLKFLLGESKL